MLVAAAAALLRRCGVCLWFRDSKCLSLTSQHPQVMCPLLEKGASPSLSFSALFMSVQAPCQKIGAWPTPVTAGGAIAAAAKAALCPSAARVRCGGGSIQLRVIILLCASFKRIVLKHSAAQVIVVMLGGGNWAEEAQVNGNHGHGLLCFGRISRSSIAADAFVTPRPSGSTGSLKACIWLQKDGPSTAALSIRAVMIEI